MWLKVKAIAVIAILSLTATLGVVNTNAQEIAPSRDTTTTGSYENDRDFDWGWIGLAGLIGLVGLMPKDRRALRNDEVANRTAPR